MPGTGLGLSIVRSIVTMLGGSVDLRSRLGHGTTVEVRLPVQRPLPGSLSSTPRPSTPRSSTPRSSTPRSSTPRSSITKLTTDPDGSHSSKDDSIRLLRGIAKGQSVAVYGLSNDDRSSGKRDSSWTLTKYLIDWFGIDVVALQNGKVPDVILVEQRDVQLLMESKLFTEPGRPPALLILCINATRHSEAQAEDSQAQRKRIVEFVSKPCGPYKLAKALHACILRLRESSFEHTGTKQSDAVTEDLSLQPNGFPQRPKELKRDAPRMHGRGTARQSNWTHPDSQGSRAEYLGTERLATNGAGVSEEQTYSPFSNTNGNKDRDPSFETPVSPTSMQTSAQTQPSSNLPMASPDSLDVTLTKSPRVLLVDDNKINLSLLQAFMRKRKYEFVDLAEDGSIAVGAIKAASEPYDVIFMGNLRRIPMMASWTY